VHGAARDNPDGAQEDSQQGKKETEPMMGDGWKTSKCSETNIVSLVDECLLQSLTII